MAATQRTYAQFWLGVLTNAFSLNWGSDTIKVGLLTSGYTPNYDTDKFWSDIVANEVANGSGYATGGATLSGFGSSENASAHEARFTAGNPSWSGATFTWRYAVAYKSTGNNATSPLIVLFDPGGPEQVTAGTASITWDATGVFKVAV